MAKQLQIYYEDYRKLIAGRAWHWTERTGYDFQELMAEGNLKFVEIQKSFNPSLSCFSTYLTISLNWHFGNITKRDLRRKENEISMDISMEEISKTWKRDKHRIEHSRVKYIDLLSRDASPEKVTMLKEMIGQLGHDARLLVECVLETPRDLLWMLGREGTGMKVSRHTLQKYFVRRKSWSISQCWKAFSEIKVALNTL